MKYTARYKNFDLMEGQDDETLVIRKTVEGDVVVTSTKAKLMVGK